MSAPSAKPMAPRFSARPNRWLGTMVGLVAFASFGYDLPSQPHFVDESAYLSQTYYADLWLSGDVNHPAWLDRPAYDLPPLPKYLFGVALRVVGRSRPGPAAAEAWYRDSSKTFVPPSALVAARWPTVSLGAAGCVAIYGLGVLAAGHRVGVLAALFLMINPLYRMHARRAMSDVPCEALMLLSLVVALWSWRELLAGRLGLGRWLAAGLAGVTGGLAMIVLAAWVLLAIALPGVRRRRRLAVVVSALLSGVVAFTVFLALNPFLTAKPRGPLSRERQTVARMNLRERVGLLISYRMWSSRSQQDAFRHNALLAPAEKIKAMAVQGFGRFGPLGPRGSDSTRRYDWAQDWGAVVWWPCVIAGLAWAWERGRRQRTAEEPPTAWAILAEAAVACGVVTAILPMAWDRYYLSLQPATSLLAAGGLVAAYDRLASALPARPRTGRA